jgi:hypothetical protein
MAILPLVMTQQGLQPASPADLRARLVAMVAAIVPDYTSNLPSTLVEDIASTDVYALVVSDSFLVDLVNSITPFGAMPFCSINWGPFMALTRSQLQTRQFMWYSMALLDTPLRKASLWETASISISARMGVYAVRMDKPYRCMQSPPPVEPGQSRQAR